MPLVESSEYKAPFYLRNTLLQTISAGKIRRVYNFSYTHREELILHDNDFLDLDWCQHGNNRVAVIIHGLEGHTQRVYMRGMAKKLLSKGWDVVAVNLRGCSGRPNALPRYYHQGSSDDLNAVITYVSEKFSYNDITIVGFSLGGNICLKYLGENNWNIPASVTSAIAISTPCELEPCAYHFNKFSNIIYLRYFLSMIREKIKIKSRLFPQYVDFSKYKSVKNFKHLDDLYTAPLHGFKCAEDYWKKTSSLQFIKNIKIPVLMLTAKDDPFLPEQCYPYEIAKKSDYVFLETPAVGGHMGFIPQKFISGDYWYEQRVIDFINTVA